MLKVSGKHILLLLLYSPGKTTEFNEPITGRIRIVKMMFLFDKEIKKSFFKDVDIELVSFPEFFPWNYGPFSKDVYNDIEFFINNGFIDTQLEAKEKTDMEMDEFEDWIKDYIFDDEEELLFPYVRNVECFQLTSKGLEFFKEKMYGQLSDNQKEIIIKFKERINEATPQAILRYTYLKYPEYTSKSNRN
jgi:uncharacterized protein YwgA